MAKQLGDCVAKVEVLAAHEPDQFRVQSLEFGVWDLGFSSGEA